jgi:hypothetical protein
VGAQPQGEKGRGRRGEEGAAAPRGEQGEGTYYFSFFSFFFFSLFVEFFFLLRAGASRRSNESIGEGRTPKESSLAVPPPPTRSSLHSQQQTKKTKTKCDNSARAAAAIADAWQSGVEPIPVSALSGSGSGDLLDAVLDALPETRPRKRVASTGTEAETVRGRRSFLSF